MTAPLLLPVLPSRYALGWPEKPKDDPISYQAAPVALRQRYASDAHTAAYSAPSVLRRLDLGAAKQLHGGVAMVALFVDVDGADHKADPAWRQSEAAKITRALAELPGGFYYQTRGGYRLVWRLATPFPIASDEDYARWRLFYWRALLALSRCFGIEGDPLCADWTRLYRLPHGTRNKGGKPEDLPTKGDPELQHPLALDIEAADLEADLAEAERLHSLYSQGGKGRWKSAVERLAKEIRGEEPPAPPPARPLPAFVTRGPLGYEDRERLYAAKALENEASDLALTGRGFRNAAARDAALRLGHYAPHLLDPSTIEQMLLAATRAAGWDNERKTRNTIIRALARGMREPKRPTLQEREYTPHRGNTNSTFEQPAGEEAPPASGPMPRLLSAEEGTAAIRAALRSPAPLVVLRSTTGAGKSAELREWLTTEATSARPAAVFVPTHRLGEQTQSGLFSLGVSAARPVGVARVRLPVVQGEGSLACVHHEAAELLARAGGHVREELCSECPARKKHPQNGGECPAYASGSTAAPVVVLQQPLLGPVLRQAAADLENRSADTDKPPPALAIVDELPPLVARVPWAAAEQARKHNFAAEMAPAALEALGPLLAAIRRQAAAPLDRPRTLRDLLALDLAGVDLDKTLAEARAIDGGALWQRSLPVRLARLSLAPDTRDHALARLAAVAALTELLRVIIEAAHEPDRLLLWPTEEGPTLAALAPWVRQMRAFIEAGGRVRLLDATAPVEALRRLWPEIELHAVEVRDAPHVRRRMLVWQHGARGRHCSPDRSLLADEVRGPLRRLAAVAVEAGARKIGLLTHKPVADALRGWLTDREADPSKPAPAWCPDELEQLVDAGAEILPGHFGAQRGLDLWAECDLLATMGDPWPNLGAAIVEAGVLELDAATWTLETTRAELVQAWGRARPVHRQGPCVVVHLGALALAPSVDWAPQWAGVPQEWPQRGRPPTVLPLTDPSTWAAERARLGLSRRDHAKALGVSWATYCRKAPKASEGDPQNDQETPEEMVAHNPQQAVFDGVAGNPAALSSLIPDYGPPDSCGFVPSEAPSGPVASSPDGASPVRPATVVALDGARRWSAERAVCPSGGPSLAGGRPGPAGGLLAAPAPQGGAWVA